MSRAARVGGLAALALIAAGAVSAQQPLMPAGSIEKLCADAADASRGVANLPFTAKALRERKRIKVLAIGATPLNERDQLQGQYGRVEKGLEAGFKGLDVEIVDRGVSGEMARDGSERIKNEVALLKPELVFWQVGVADALALTPADELKATLSRTVKWLKDHEVDVVLIGLRYQRSLATNPSYQQIRTAIRDVVREESILRIGHYESMEALDRVRRQEGAPASELDLTDAGSICLADFLSRALAVGLFARPRPDQAGPARPGNEPEKGPTEPAPVQPVPPPR